MGFMVIDLDVIKMKIGRETNGTGCPDPVNAK
jgi:hypothetical protein